MLDFLRKYDRIIYEILTWRCNTMAYKITDECIACGACAGECPGNAISEGDGKFVIDADECIECGACEGVCPVGAPIKDE